MHTSPLTAEQSKHLIADLLAALKGLLASPVIADENHTDPEWGDPETAEAISAARQAVAKAEGK